jgi:hypothetical protein
LLHHRRGWATGTFNQYGKKPAGWFEPFVVTWQSAGQKRRAWRRLLWGEEIR